MLGPIRFDHIKTCAGEVCHIFRIKDELEESIATLGSLDDMLSLLRSELAEHIGQKEKSVGHVKKQDYKALADTQDLAKAKRLITARENSIKSVQALLRKAKEKTSQADSVLDT